MKKYAQRQKEKPKIKRFTPEIQEFVEYWLKEDYSPEQIVGKSKNENIACVSIERIYQHIWQDKKNKGSLYTHLRRNGRSYRKRGAYKDSRGIIKNRVSIEQRAPEIEKRLRFGDLEVDLIIGKNHNQSIVTLNDRASEMLKIRKMASKEASIVSSAIMELLKEWSPYIYTITSSNVKEFANHEQISEALNINYYFAHPYHSWERGLNENLNGLIRQYYPKKSDFSSLPDEDFKEVENKLNSRARKRFNFQSPTFVMNQLLFSQKVECKL